MPLISLDITHLPARLRQLLELELDGEENVLWIGRPRTRWFLIGSLPLFGFGIFWTAFSIYWVYLAATQGGQADPGESDTVTQLFPFFGIPFVLVGLGMLSSPLWKIRLAKRTLYAITSRRAISFNGGHFSIEVNIFDSKRMKKSSRNQKADGSGDLIFASDDESRQYTLNNGFYGIANVKEVEALVKDVVTSNA